MTDRLHLFAKHRRMLENLLREHLSGVEAWAYGSRVNRRSHDGSDLDLVLRSAGLKEIPIDQLADFHEALRESNIPFLVEAHDWARLPERFHREIEREYVLLTPPSENRGGEIEWNESIWGDFATLEYGKALRANDMRGGSVPVFGTNGQIGWHDEPLSSGPGVIVGRKGAYRGVHYSPDPFYVIDTAFYLRPKTDLDTRWAYYQLLTQDINGMDSGSAIPSTSREEFYGLPVAVPPPKAQRAIADVLGTLDDKIKLSRRMNETLEAIARAIFKDWFVDFGPVRAKSEGSAPYLPPELWAMFPDALDEEDKPVGWVKGTLADVAESPRRGINPSDVCENTPHIGLRHMPRRSIAISEWEGAGKVKSNKTQFNRGEILFGKLRPYFHKVGVAPLDGICSTDIVVVVPRAREWRAFALACLSSDEFVNYTDRTSTGTKMPRTSWKTMAQYKMCLPSKQVVCAFQDIARPLLDNLGENVRQMSTLAETRNLLLPKLISGEVRACVAERDLEMIGPTRRATVPSHD